MRSRDDGDQDRVRLSPIRLGGGFRANPVRHLEEQSKSDPNICVDVLSLVGEVPTDPSVGIKSRLPPR